LSLNQELPMRQVALLLAVPLVAACARQPASRNMWTFHHRAGTIQHALLSGDLQAARAGGAWIAQHPTDHPGGSPAHAAAMIAAARDLSTSPDIPDAARTLGHLGTACAGCHAAVGRGPQFAAVAAPPSAGAADVGQQMTRHIWALGKLWDGLTGPAEMVWLRGAGSLTDEAVYAQHIRRNGTPGPAADSLARRLVSLALAAGAAAPAERGHAYGRILGACADCHQQHRVQLPALPIGL
jgi:cytochrome c553